MNLHLDTRQKSKKRALQSSLLAVVLMALLTGCAQQVSSDVMTALSAENRNRIRSALLLTAWQKPSNPEDFKTCVASSEELSQFVASELKPADAAQLALLQRFSAPSKPFSLVTDPKATAIFRSGIKYRREAFSEIATLMRPSGVSDALVVVVRPQIMCRIVLAQQAGPIVPPSQQRHIVDISTTSELIDLKPQVTLYKAIDRGRRGREVQLANLRSGDSLRTELKAQYAALANQIFRHLSAP